LIGWIQLKCGLEKIIKALNFQVLDGNGHFFSSTPRKQFMKRNETQFCVGVPLYF